MRSGALFGGFLETRNLACLYPQQLRGSKLCNLVFSYICSSSFQIYHFFSFLFLSSLSSFLSILFPFHHYFFLFSLLPFPGKLENFSYLPSSAATMLLHILSSATHLIEREIRKMTVKGLCGKESPMFHFDP